MWRWVGFALCVVLLCASAYASAGVGTVRPGTTIVHDDFTYTVERVAAHAEKSSEMYEVTLRVENRAKRVPYLWQDAIAYVVDEHGHKYHPISRGTLKLAAGSKAWVHPRFRLPQQVRKPTLRFWDSVFMGDVFDGVQYARTAVALY
ncbi:MAG: hypothetical protein JO024_01465 [Candidatus Eremiobacteraeota bacterium]|nr:hypothetical protein [Candidatus Eremiobacteraeota bacterium]MBV9736786.1 hypothetical protein [Candidatus Eremiobacteraeota bacterium]